MSEHIVTASGLKIVHILPKVLAVLRLPKDWTNKDDVAEWLLAVAELFDEIAAATPNDIDNKIAGCMRYLATNENFIGLVVNIIEQLQVGSEPQFTGAEAKAFVEASIPEEAAFDPSIVVVIVQLIIQILKLIKG